VVRRETLRGPPPGDERIAILRFEGRSSSPAPIACARRSTVADVDVVVLRMSRVELVDATGARMLGEIVQSLERRGSPC
jgi:SulP family sulfate permease